MAHLTIDKGKCTSCGLCALDCSLHILTMADNFPSLKDPEQCFQCQHCLAICPQGALAIADASPERCMLLAGQFPEPRQMEVLIKGRRSYRRYKDENLPAELIRQLLDVASYAPSGSNSRAVRFTLVEDKKAMAELREIAMAGFARLEKSKGLPPGLEYFGWYASVWENHKRDILFRGAPHLVVVSAPNSCQTPLQDCTIALTYLELYAQSHGLGTLWDGVFTIVLEQILPELRSWLHIPDDHVIGESMVFGRPAVTYFRTTEHGPADVHRVGVGHQ